MLALAQETFRGVSIKHHTIPFAGHLVADTLKRQS
jgi:hypothetical protein